jgi:CPA1 family monovalent cation:H+ antiporter
MLILISVLVGVAAFFGWMSSRVLKMPNTIGTMLLTAVTSISLVLLARVWPEPHDWALRIVGQVNFERLILHGMLALLLFAGASLLDLDALREQKLPVALLATLTTVISIGGVGVATYCASRAFGFRASLVEALLFGAIISPTDPIAVLEMLRRVRTPKYLEAQLAGESLFNDGVGAVIVIGLLGAAHGEHSSLPVLSLRILIASGGGMALGVLLAFPIAFLMRNVQSISVDILLSLALALGGYAIADHFSISAPLETVTGALVLRYLTERQPSETIAHTELHRFWSMLDEVQNAILFVLLGCGFLVLSFERNEVYLGLSEIVIVSAMRVASVSAVILLLKLIRPRTQSSIPVLSWGGLRGGLSIALALSVPKDLGGGWIVTSTYVMVVFSILAQGSTMGLFIQSRLKSVPVDLADAAE